MYAYSELSILSRMGKVNRMSATLGEKIYELRTKKGFTLGKLAEETNSSKSYIWELENKNPPRPSAEKLAKIADKLGVDVEYLLDETGKLGKEDAADARFYRKFRQMDDKTKAKIRSLVDIWDGDQ